MKRRSFIQIITGLVTATGIAPHVRSEAHRVNRSTLLQTSPVAGFQYYQGEGLWPQLQLHRAADNHYDKQAIRIDWQGHQLGYLPHYDNTTISQILDRSEKLSAQISHLQKDSSPWQRVQLNIRLEI